MILEWGSALEINSGILLKRLTLRPVGLKFPILVIEEGFFNINKSFYLAGQVGPK